VIVSLVEAGTENVIRPVENNQDGLRRGRAMRPPCASARENAPGLAQRLVQQANSGEYSLSDMQDAANALLLLSRAEE
jgi:hypothetical protein